MRGIADELGAVIGGYHKSKGMDSALPPRALYVSRGYYGAVPGDWNWFNWWNWLYTFFETASPITLTERDFERGEAPSSVNWDWYNPVAALTLAVDVFEYLLRSNFEQGSVGPVVLMGNGQGANAVVEAANVLGTLGVGVDDLVILNRRPKAVPTWWEWGFDLLSLFPVNRWATAVARTVAGGLAAVAGEGASAGAAAVAERVTKFLFDNESGFTDDVIRQLANMSIKYGKKSDLPIIGSLETPKSSVKKAAAGLASRLARDLVSGYESGQELAGRDWARPQPEMHNVGTVWNIGTSEENLVGSLVEVRNLEAEGSAASVGEKLARKWNPRSRNYPLNLCRLDCLANRFVERGLISLKAWVRAFVLQEELFDRSKLEAGPRALLGSLFRVHSAWAEATERRIDALLDSPPRRTAVVLEGIK